MATRHIKKPSALRKPQEDRVHAWIAEHHRHDDLMDALMRPHEDANGMLGPSWGDPQEMVMRGLQEQQWKVRKRIIEHKPQTLAGLAAALRFYEDCTGEEGAMTEHYRVHEYLGNLAKAADRLAASA